MLLVYLFPAVSPAQEMSDTVRREAVLEGLRAELIELRRDLHRHPEVSGQERRTARIVTERLRGIGLEVRTGIGGHGVVAIVRGGTPGRTLAFRADMDAVYSQAPDPVPFRSLTPGVRHICGHDLHTVVGVALAQVLRATRESWAGTVVFLFQPEEENALGAHKMIAAGCLDDPRPEAIYAFHSSPLEVGSLGVTPGQALPQRDAVRVTLRGGGDLSAVGARVRRGILALNSLEDPRTARPRTEAYTVANVFASGPGSDAGTWVLRAQVTASSAAVGEDAARRLEDLLSSSAFDGVAAELEYTARHVPGVLNDGGVLREARAALETLEPAELRPALIVSHGSPPQFSEDFGAFQEHLPGVMFWLGVSNAERGTRGMPHSPDYVADEEALFVGTRAMAAILVARLGS